MYIRTLDPDWIAEQDALYDDDLRQAERAADAITSDPMTLLGLLGENDTAELFDGGVRVRYHGKNLPLADVAIALAFMPADEREVMLADIKHAVRQWIVNREMEA